MEREKRMIENLEDLFDLIDRIEPVVDIGDFKYRLIYDKVADDSGRWYVSHEVVAHSVDDDKYFSFGYSKPATECQDWDDFDQCPIEMNQVFPKEVTVTVYE